MGWFTAIDPIADTGLALGLARAETVIGSMSPVLEDRFRGPKADWDFGPYFFRKKSL